jgi:alpha-1,6-mannosyltransferase
MQERFPKTLLLSGLSILILYAGSADLAVTRWLASELPSETRSASILWVLAWTAYLPAVIWVARRPPSRGRAEIWTLFWIVLLGLLFRIVLLPGEPNLSGDYYRYLWDGRLFHGGVNPYAFPPTSPALASFRYDDLHTHLNRPDGIGLYPPLAQWVFRAVAAIRPDALGLRISFLAFEAIGVAVLLLLLRRTGRPLAQVLIYLWNPLIVIEMTRGGHSDALMLPFLLLAIHHRMGGKMARAGVALGLATLARLYPMVILPALMTRSRTPGRGVLGFEPALPAAFAITVLLGYFPFAAMDGGLGAPLASALGSDWEEFNAGIRLALRHLLAWMASAEDPWVHAPAAGRILLAGYALFCVRVLLRREEDGRTPARAAALLGGWLLVATPSVEPWYAWGLVAIAAVTVAPAWIWFSGAAGLSYLKFVSPTHLVPPWVLGVEFIPTLALLAYAAAKVPEGGARRMEQGEDPGWSRPLPPPRRRWIRIPIYLIGAFPLVAIVLVLFFFFLRFVQ